MINHVAAGKSDAFNPPFKTAGTGQDVDFPGQQFGHCLVSLFVAQKLDRHSQPVTNEPQVIGAEALVVIAIIGDIDRFVIAEGDTHTQRWVIGQPLLFRGIQLQRLELDKACCKPEGQTMVGNGRLHTGQENHRQQ